jgi:hypothetical protein
LFTRLNGKKHFGVDYKWMENVTGRTEHIVGVSSYEKIADGFMVYGGERS